MLRVIETFYYLHSSTRTKRHGGLLWSLSSVWNTFGISFALEERDPARRDQIFATRLKRILCRTVSRLGELQSKAVVAAANTTAPVGLRCRWSNGISDHRRLVEYPRACGLKHFRQPLIRNFVEKSAFPHPQFSSQIHHHSISCGSTLATDAYCVHLQYMIP